jgi:hypothetical protein
MSEFKGTPGPWNNKDVSICSQHEAELQLGFLSTGDVSRRAEGLANAYLITAAPDLLEALQAVWDSCCTNAASKPSKKALLMAHAAINKALGR